MRRLASPQHPKTPCSSSLRALVAPVLLGLVASVALWGCGGSTSLSNLDLAQTTLLELRVMQSQLMTWKAIDVYADVTAMNQAEMDMDAGRHIRAWYDANRKLRLVQLEGFSKKGTPYIESLYYSKDETLVYYEVDDPQPDGKSAKFFYDLKKQKLLLYTPKMLPEALVAFGWKRAGEMKAILAPYKDKVVPSLPASLLGAAQDKGPVFVMGRLMVPYYAPSPMQGVITPCWHSKRLMNPTYTLKQDSLVASILAGMIDGRSVRQGVIWLRAVPMGSELKVEEVIGFTPGNRLPRGCQPDGKEFYNSFRPVSIPASHTIAP